MAEEPSSVDETDAAAPATVLYEIEHKIATITLNRPEKRNALRWEELDTFWNYLKQSVEDENVKIIRIKSVGDKAFSAGLDLNMISSMDRSEVPKLLHYGDGINRTMIECKKPIVTQVQGVAAGWGCMICCSSDFVIAADNPEIYFSLPEIDVGMFPATGALMLAYTRFGFNLAKKMLLIPQKISLETAVQKDFVTETVPIEELDKHTFEFCRSLVKKFSGILYLSKAVLNKIHYQQIEQYFDWENQALDLCKTTEESEWDAFVKRLWENQ